VHLVYADSDVGLVPAGAFQKTRQL
jgi:hypothetical protein